MRTADPMTETEQFHRLSENLMSRLAKGRQWATPGLAAALQKAVAGLDNGIESASPRLQAVLRRIADDLVGGVETLTPQVQERLRRVGPKTAAQVTVPVDTARMLWWIGGLLAVAAAGIGVWRSLKISVEEPVPSPTEQEAGAGEIPSDSPDEELR